jgi:CRP-like cAMP-binding protein
MALSVDDKVQLLGGVQLFAEVGPEGLRHVAERCVEVAYPAGRWIVRQGEVGTGFFLIVSGRARVVRNDELIGELGPGEFFGELSILDGQPRVAHVVADEPTACLALTSWDFEALIEAQPKLAIAILKGVARRLRDVDERLRN